MFAKYALTPKRGLSFGPLTYNNTSDSRAFEISNTGEFPLAFNLFNYGESESREREREGNLAPPPKAAGRDTLSSSVTSRCRPRRNGRARRKPRSR